MTKSYTCELECLEEPTELLIWSNVIHHSVTIDKKHQVSRLGHGLKDWRSIDSVTTFQDAIAKHQKSGMITVGSDGKISHVHMVEFDVTRAKIVGIKGSSILATAVEIDLVQSFIEPVYVETEEMNRLYKATCTNKIKNFWSPKPKLPKAKGDGKGSGDESGNESDGTTSTSASARSVSLIPKKSKNKHTSLNNYVLIPPIISAMLLTMEGELSVTECIDTMATMFNEFIVDMDLSEATVAKMVQFFKWIIGWMGAANAQMLLCVDWVDSSQEDSRDHLLRNAPANIAVFLETKVWNRESNNSKTPTESDEPAPTGQAGLDLPERRRTYAEAVTATLTGRVSKGTRKVAFRRKAPAKVPKVTTVESDDDDTESSEPQYDDNGEEIVLGVESDEFMAKLMNAKDNATDDDSIQEVEKPKRKQTSKRTGTKVKSILKKNDKTKKEFRRGKEPLTSEDENESEPNRKSEKSATRRHPKRKPRKSSRRRSRSSDSERSDDSESSAATSDSEKSDSSGYYRRRRGRRDRKRRRSSSESDSAHSDADKSTESSVRSSVRSRSSRDDFKSSDDESSPDSRRNSKSY